MLAAVGGAALAGGTKGRTVGAALAALRVQVPTLASGNMNLSIS